MLFPTNQLEPNLDQAFAVLCVPTVNVTKESVESILQPENIPDRVKSKSFFYYVLIVFNPALYFPNQF